jgi:hypothetical protein
MFPESLLALHLPHVQLALTGRLESHGSCHEPPHYYKKIVSLHRSNASNIAYSVFTHPVAFLYPGDLGPTENSGRVGR